MTDRRMRTLIVNQEALEAFDDILTAQYNLQLYMDEIEGILRDDNLTSIVKKLREEVEYFAKHHTSND